MPTLPAWRRIHVPTSDDARIPGAATFQDLAGRYLCSVGLSLLNSRHIAEEPPLDSRNVQHVEALERALHRVAVEIFADAWSDPSPGSAHLAARLRLDQAKLLDGTPQKVLWVLAAWKPEKVEGRRRGGRHGAAQGVRKGKTPRWVPAQLEPFADLPDRQRKAQAMAALGCSASTYFELWKRYRARQAMKADPANWRGPSDAELVALLPEHLR